MTWALSAHNNVETHHGYSPTHLLFGLGSGKNSVEDMGLVDNLGEEDDLRYANLLKHTGCPKKNSPVAFLSISPIKLHLLGSPRTVLKSAGSEDSKTVPGSSNCSSFS